MNSRPLSPFLISFALLFLLTCAAPVLAQAPAASDADVLREAVLADLARQLTTQFNAEGELQLEFVRPWTPPSGVNDVAGIQVTVSEYPTVLSASMLVRGRVAIAGLPGPEETFLVRGQLWRDSWVARNPVDRGMAFAADACDVRRVDTLRERDALPVSAAASSEWVFVRAVPAGRLLTWRDVARRALVRRGQLIEVAAVDGGLQVTMKALAMQDGAQGETVRVRNVDTKREFAAVVVSENRALVRF